MVFGMNGGKLQVLESKLHIYEELSKQMLDKLERAVATISESSNKVAIVLERHENRLDENQKSDALIIKMFEDLKAENKLQHKSVENRILELETKITDLARFRWVTIGIAIAAVTILNAAEIFSGVLTPGKQPATMEQSAYILHASR